MQDFFHLAARCIPNKAFEPFPLGHFRSPLSTEFTGHCILRGGTQRRALPQYFLYTIVHLPVGWIGPGRLILRGGKFADPLFFASHKVKKSFLQDYIWSWLRLYRYYTVFVCQITNSYNGIKNNVSSKSDLKNHGIGKYNMEESLKKYQTLIEWRANVWVNYQK